MSKTLVAALYKFAVLDDFRDLQGPLLDTCRANGVKGTLLLAGEGINGTIAGSQDGIRAVLAYLRADARLAALEHKEAWADEMPFRRMKVRLKKEIVTLGVDGLDPVGAVGTYVKPEDWNELISDPDVLVIDTRNDYEVAIGQFKGAVDPKTDSFREFPAWLEDSRLLEKNRRVAMYCTGGIRCEKSTAYLRSLGVNEVYHLQGGILKYLEEVPAENSLWDGECFVFDERVSVGHGLTPGPYGLCRGCRWPITDEDRASALFEEGVCCPHCHATLTPERRERFAERQKQMDLAKQRHQVHLGEEPNQ